MEREQIVARLHAIAADMAAGGAGDAGSAESNSVHADNVLRRYAFTSIDAIEYLLAIEEDFNVTFEDEDLTEELLTSTDRLADRILDQLAADTSP